jgi:hypothetical protein
MKKIRVFLIAFTALALGSGVALAGPTTLKLKKGDTAYVCGCGEKCSCEVVSLKAAKCSCGHDLVKVAITNAKDKKAYFEIGGKEQSVSLKAKYSCPCEGDCCKFISQKPGKCPCNKDLAKVEKKAKKEKKEKKTT